MRTGSKWVVARYGHCMVASGSPAGTGSKEQVPVGQGLFFLYKVLLVYVCLNRGCCLQRHYVMLFELGEKPCGLYGGLY